MDERRDILRALLRAAALHLQRETESTESTRVKRLSIPAALYQVRQTRELLQGFVHDRTITAAASKAVPFAGKTLDVAACSVDCHAGGDIWTDRGQMYRVVDAAIIAAQTGTNKGAEAEESIMMLLGAQHTTSQHTFFGLDSF